jgi:hypothetical protein
MKTLSKTKTDKFDKILKESSVEGEKDKLSKDEKIELKSYAIKKVLKLKKYVRN